MLEYYEVGMLEYNEVGMLEYNEVGMLEYDEVGMLEYDEAGMRILVARFLSCIFQNSRFRGGRLNHEQSIIRI